MFKFHHNVLKFVVFFCFVFLPKNQLEMKTIILLSQYLAYYKLTKKLTNIYLKYDFGQDHCDLNL